jgi:hypothetical protein
MQYVSIIHGVTLLLLRLEIKVQCWHRSKNTSNGIIIFKLTFIKIVYIFRGLIVK